MRDRLIADSIVALKAGEKVKSIALRYLVSLIDKKNLSLPQPMDEAGEIVVLQKELKNKEESRASFEKAARSDLLAEVAAEIELLATYLPKPLTDPELEEIIEKHVQNEKNFGEIMKLVAVEVAGRADGARIAQIVKCKI